MGFAGAMAVAMAMDAVFGWPAGLFTRVGHPVTWLGRLIAALDERCNRDTDAPRVRRLAGAVAASIVIALAAGVGWLLQSLVTGGCRIALVGIIAWPFVALRSLCEHVVAVARPLQAGELEAARAAVAKIVGRDPVMLDHAGVARAAIESLAENTSDGVVAPLFWGALLGLPGIIGYKAINTLDSMIGHRTMRYAQFGWAAARIDDLANFIPARITGLLFALLAQRPSVALSCMVTDARHHRSLNAGWPEAAMAGALGVRLSGPRIYHGRVTDEPWLNRDARDPAGADIMRGVKLYLRVLVLLAAAIVGLAAA